MSMNHFKPIPEALISKIQNEGWKGELRWDAVYGQKTLGGFLAHSYLLKPNQDLTLFEACLQAGLPFFIPPDLLEMNNRLNYLDNITNVLIDYSCRSFDSKAQAIWDCLFKAGFDINQRFEFEHHKTILMFVCEVETNEPDRSFLQYLLNHNVDLHLQDDYGMTALLYLASFHPFSLPWLIEQGANPKDTYQDTKTGEVLGNVLSLALGYFWDVIEYDEYENEKTIQALFEKLIQLGSDPYLILGNQQTMLHCAYSWCPSLIPFLIQIGVDLTIQDHQGRTILDLCQESASSSNFTNPKVNDTYRNYVQQIIEKMKEPYQKLPKASDSSIKTKRI